MDHSANTKFRNWLPIGLQFQILTSISKWPRQTEIKNEGLSFGEDNRIPRNIPDDRTTKQQPTTNQALLSPGSFGISSLRRPARTLPSLPPPLGRLDAHAPRGGCRAGAGVRLPTSPVEPRARQTSSRPGRRPGLARPPAHDALAAPGFVLAMGRPLARRPSGRAGVRLPALPARA